jgi:hypothetical protein
MTFYEAIRFGMVHGMHPTSCSIEHPVIILGIVVVHSRTRHNLVP